MEQFDTEHFQQVSQRIMRAWLKIPELRLGQLIANAIDPDGKLEDGEAENVLFFAEDESLVEKIEAFARENESENSHNPDPVFRDPMLGPPPPTESN